MASDESVGRRTLGREASQLGGVPVPQTNSVTVGQANKLNELTNKVGGEHCNLFRSLSASNSLLPSPPS